MQCPLIRICKKRDNCPHFCTPKAAVVCALEKSNIPQDMYDFIISGSWRESGMSFSKDFEAYLKGIPLDKSVFCYAGTMTNALTVGGLRLGINALIRLALATPAKASIYYMNASLFINLVKESMDARELVPECNQVKKLAREATILVVDGCNFSKYSDFEIGLMHNVLMLRKVNKLMTIVTQPGTKFPADVMINNVLSDYHLLRVQ